MYDMKVARFSEIIMLRMILLLLAELNS